MANSEIARVESYTPEHRSQLVGLWNQIFRDYPRAQHVTERDWERRIEGAVGFNPSYLRVALAEQHLVGFAHGGTWQGEFLRQALPDEPLPLVPYLAMVGVAVEHRRRGVGRLLLESLRATVFEHEEQRYRDCPDFVPPLPLRADGRMFNPFYGNMNAPLSPFWGAPEGPLLPAQQDGVRAFFARSGFREAQHAVSLRLDMTSWQRVWDEQPEWELARAQDYLPTLRTADGYTFAAPNQSQTWVAVPRAEPGSQERPLQAGCVIAYPLAGTAGDWGIYSLEVAPEARGRGVGRWLLTAALQDLSEREVRSVEALVLPGEAQAADRLYRSMGFVESDQWVVLQ